MEIIDMMDHIQRGETLDLMSHVSVDQASKTQTGLSQFQTGSSSGQDHAGPVINGSKVVEFEASDFNPRVIESTGGPGKKVFSWTKANDSVTVTSVQWTANQHDGNGSDVLANVTLAKDAMMIRDDSGLISFATQTSMEISLKGFINIYGDSGSGVEDGSQGGPSTRHSREGDILALQVGWTVSDTNRSGYSQTPIFTVTEAPGMSTDEAFNPSGIMTIQESNGFDKVTYDPSKDSPSDFKTGTGGGGGGGDAPSTPQATSSSGGGSSHGGLSTGAIAGIAVGGGAALLLALAAIIFLLCRRKRRQRNQQTMDDAAAAYKSNTIMEDKQMHTHAAVATNSPYSDDEGGPGSGLMAARSADFAYYHHEPAVPPPAATVAAGRQTSHSYTRDDVGGGDENTVTQRQVHDPAGRRSGSRSETPQGGVSHAVAHLVEDGMTEDEIRRLEEEERQLDAEIARAGEGGRGR